jgi:glycerate dehydrogenase
MHLKWAEKSIKCEDNTMKIVILDGYTLNPGDNPWDGFQEFGETEIYDRTNTEQVVERAKGADIIALNKVKITDAILEQLPDLKCVLVMATGYDCIDINAAASRKITVSNVPVYGTESVAEFVFALVLELSRHPALHHQSVKNGEWTQNPDWCYWKKPLIELKGKTLGIIGFGRIGRKVGEIGYVFGMKVLANDINQINEPKYTEFSWATIEEVFENSDYISLHCNQTEHNYKFVNGALLQKMKKNSFLINTSRGGLIDEADLAKALNTESIAGAALDVVGREPIVPDNPLLEAKNIILTPHISWATLEARKRLMRICLQNLKAFLEGHPENVVN